MLLKTKSLTPEILHVVSDKGTEPPFSGEYDDQDQAGTYLCRQCGLALFRAQSKFPSGCGWPSFDDEIPNAVAKIPDSDGRRTEITCSRCLAHLGHVFHGENMTPKNTRHCVNSLSLDFVADLVIPDTEEAIFAAGCFWGVEYYFKKCPGVVKTEVGYTGGQTNHPRYEAVCTGETGHIEAIRVLYNPNQISYEQLVKYFFEIHDPEQTDGQGPDIGNQYISAIFYYNDDQKQIAQKVIDKLTEKKVKVATQLRGISPFWKAENYHQDYYFKNNKSPYCHHYVKRF